MTTLNMANIHLLFNISYSKSEIKLQGYDILLK